jgi:hypothetical protein
VALPTSTFGTEFWTDKARGINTIQSAEMKRVAVAAGCAGLGRIESNKDIWRQKVVFLVHTIGHVGGIEV